MAKTLEAHDKLIREIFEGSYQFEIPDYQRPYAWTTEQATELFDDLYSAMQDARVSGASSQYFLGSIVLIKNDRDPKSSVVDGQQRLSTLTMLFAVLRTVMPDAADDITDFLYKKGKVSLGEKNEYRLTAREEDADFFRSNIQEPGDEGWLLQLEARKSLGAAELYAFYDHGKVKVDARPELVSSPAPDQERAGAGVGIRINEGPMKVNVALAWRTKGGVPTSAANAGSDPRMWMSMMYSF